MSQDENPKSPPPEGAKKTHLTYDEVAQLAFLGVEALTRILISKGIATEVEIQAVVAEVRREYTAKLDEITRGDLN